MPKRNERTSKRVAKIAGRILGIKVRYPKRGGFDVFDVDDVCHGFRWADIVTLAASALTQTADKTPAKRLSAKAALVKRLSKRGGWPRVAKRKRR